MAHQYILGYSVSDDGVEDVIKEWRYNQGYLATIKYEQKTARLTRKMNMKTIK